MTDRETKSELPEELPPGLPVPEDDGVAGHLPGKHLPSVALRSTSGNVVDLSALAGVGVAYCFPMIGRRADSKVLYPVFPPDKNAAEVVQWPSEAS